jgi:hypothetical protein
MKLGQIVTTSESMVNGKFDTSGDGKSDPWTPGWVAE